MIEVSIRIKGREEELAHIEIENLGHADEYGDYTIRFGVDTGVGPAVYQRSVDRFPRRRYNVLALLRLALETLEEKDLTLDADPDSRNPPDMARRLGRSLWPF